MVVAFLRLFLVVVCLHSLNRVSIAEPLRDTIDRLIAQGWNQHKIQPAARSSDAEFLRRVSLDLLGVIPNYKTAQAFIHDADPLKRPKLIARLLAHPRFALHQSDLWDMVYFGRNPPGFGTRTRDEFKTWLREQFTKNVGFDQIVRQILMAEGNTVDHGPPMFFVQYRNRPEDAAEAITQKFLGIQLQCARCHDHPYDDWTQRDFYGVAAFFARLRVVSVGKRGRLTKYAIGEKNRGDVVFTGPAAEQVVGKKGEPVKPKFPHGKSLSEPILPKAFKEPRNFKSGTAPPAPKFSRKNAFAKWAVSPDNPYFARATVNRIWGNLMGKALVSPVDNLSKTNPASHPKLLAAMTKSFVAKKFDVKWLVREIVSSRSYQLSSAGVTTKDHPLWYERARFRPLSAEELLESWVVATGYQDSKSRTKRKNKKERLKNRAITWSYMIRFFGSPNDGVGDFQGGMHEHLYLNNGQVHRLISKRPGGLYDSVMKSKEPWEKKVDRLFLQILTRMPTKREKDRFASFLQNLKQRPNRLHDAIWTLMTCSEFRFNH